MKAIKFMERLKKKQTKNQTASQLWQEEPAAEALAEQQRSKMGLIIPTEFPRAKGFGASSASGCHSPQSPERGSFPA